VLKPPLGSRINHQIHHELFENLNQNKQTSSLNNIAILFVIDWEACNAGQVNNLP